VWQPGFLASRSTGICTKSDPDCTLSVRTADSEIEDGDIQHQGRTITSSQAQSICRTHVDAYFGESRRAPHQRSASANNTIANVLAGCEADLIFAGQSEVSDRTTFN
jgi:hypothetical protein